MDGIFNFDVYADGGVIWRNPSKFGGTYGFRIFDRDKGTLLVEDFGVVPTHDPEYKFITNNVSELFAVLFAFQHLPENAHARVYTDSMNTIGRLSSNWRLRNVPGYFINLKDALEKRLKNWSKFQYTLLDGHPTKGQLESGIGKRGHPVSIHNVWCDEACGIAASRFLSSNKNLLTRQEEIHRFPIRYHTLFGRVLALNTESLLSVLIKENMIPSDSLGTDKVYSLPMAELMVNTILRYWNRNHPKDDYSFVERAFEDWKISLSLNAP